jgi:glycosyltransferase involved in cell wall biosynthesis
VESVLRQSHASLEIIAVDDASSDGTAGVLQSFGSAITLERPSVNGGAAAARNRGASVAKGKYLVFLDGDDVLTPWSLKVYSRIIEERSPKLILGSSCRFYGDAPVLAAAPSSDIRFAEFPTFLDKDRSWVYNTSSLVVERAAFAEAGGWSPEIFYQDIQDLLNKLCITGRTDMVLAPDTVLYRMHSTNAVRRIAPFIEGIDKLLAKAAQGVYPGDRTASKKRTVWFGGLIFFWGKEGILHGHFLDGMKLLLSHWWMVLMAIIRRATAWMTGRGPIQVLTLDPIDPENPPGSRTQPLAGEHSGSL